MRLQGALLLNASLTDGIVGYRRRDTCVIDFFLHPRQGFCGLCGWKTLYEICRTNSGLRRLLEALKIACNGRLTFVRYVVRNYT